LRHARPPLDPVARPLLDLLASLPRHHHASRNRVCAERAAEAAALAEAQGAAAELADARFWEGVALHSQGRLAAACEALGRGVACAGLGVDAGTLYLAATRYLRVLVELPAPRHQIEAIASEIERGIGSLDDDRRSRVLIARARHELSRGRFEQALDAAERSLEAWRHERLVCTASTHYWMLVLLCVFLGRTDQARDWLDEWELAANGPEPTDDVFRAALRSLLARREGDAARAVACAEEARRLARGGDAYALRLARSYAAVRAHHFAGDLRAARAPLAALLALRHTETGEHAHVIRLVRADHHLACARRRAGLPMLDVESGIAFEPPPGDLDASGARRELARARRAYARAAPRAHALDALFECDLRARELTARLALVAATAREIEARHGRSADPAGELGVR
jgi:tetratricopeptide (TPR) repeat protein